MISAPTSESADARRPARGRAAALAYMTSGVALGVAWFDPRMWPFAWLAPAALVIALHQTRRIALAFVGVWAAGLASHLIGFDWVPEMNAISIGYTGATGVFFDVAQMLAWTLCPALVIAAGFAVFRRRLPIAPWLAVAWPLGEYARYRLLAISIDDWLNTQWTVEPVLAALAHIGWWPTVALAILLGGALGQACVEEAPRRWRWAALAGGLAIGAILTPAAPRQGDDLLAGIAAVHVRDALTLPHRAPPGEALDLIVWPEDAQHRRPYLGVGPGRGVHIEPLLPDSPADHLVGLVTRSPNGALRNQFVAVDPTGAVIASRAKRHLMPVAERSWLGLVGHDRFRTGRQPPFMPIAGRPAVPLICGELLSRELTAEGVARGGRVMLVGARDAMMATDRALRHLLAVQVMRSVEYGVPSVRASQGGWASFVASDGTVLARSGRARNGFLMWSADGGARDVDFFGRRLDKPDAPGVPAAADGPTVAVLYTEEDPGHRTRCPEGRCTYHALEGFTCADQRADSVIIAGHGRPPDYLSHPAEQVAAAARCFGPELVVVDTCYGASSELFGALAAGADEPPGPLIVGATSLVPTAGLRYGADFFAAPTADARAAAVSLPHGTLTRWRADRAQLVGLLAEVGRMDPDTLRGHLVRRDPVQVAVPLGEAGALLVPVEWARVAAGRPRAPDRRRPRRRPPSPRPDAVYAAPAKDAGS